MVKSRRRTSSRGEVENCTASGRRPSEYEPSWRKVATSVEIALGSDSQMRTTPKSVRLP